MQEFLKQIAIFAGLDEEEIQLLSEAAVEKHYNRSDRIIREGAPGSSMFIIRDGTVSVVEESPNGNLVDLATFKRGEFFGEMSLFDGKPRSATVVAQDDTTVVEISRESFLKIVLRQPDIALKIVAELSSRFRNTDEIVREYSGRIYREAYGNIEKELRFKLESVEKLYEAVKSSSLMAVEHVERSWKSLTRFIQAVTAVAAVILVFFGWVGFNEYHKFQEIYGDIQSKSSSITEKLKIVGEQEIEAKKHVEDMSRAKESNIIMENITLKLGRIRSDLALDKGSINHLSLELLKLGHESYKESKKELKSYITNYTDNNPIIVLEAIDIILSLTQQGKMILDHEDILSIHDALLYFSKNTNNGWRVRRSIRNYATALEKLSIGEPKIMRDWRNIFIDKKVNSNAREDAINILIASDYREWDNEEDKVQIKNMLKETLRNSENFWKRRNSAISLMIMGDKEGLQYLIEKSRRRNIEGLWSAISFSYMEKNKFKDIITGGEELYENMTSTIGNEIRTTISSMKENHDKEFNPFLEEYAKKIAACLSPPIHGCP